LTTLSKRRPEEENLALGTRLDGWKEIATFLNRGERTVKRWERERGLPVHRVPFGDRASVFAWPGELADWLKGKALELESDNLATIDPGASLPNIQATNGSAAQHSTAPAEIAPVPVLPGVGGA